METKIKWNEGEGYITATYDGSGSGSASISSDVNEGIDREQNIKVETTDKSVSATLVVTQEGLREVFLPSDGDFILADGGTFNVLKGMKEYTEIEYLESTGTQYIATGFTAQPSDDYTITEEIEWMSYTGSNSYNSVEGQTDGTHQAFFGPNRSNGNKLYFGLNAGSVLYTDTDALPLNTPTKITLKRSSGNSTIVKDDVVLFEKSVNGPTIRYYYIFGCCLYNSLTYVLNKVKIYRAKFEKNGATVLDLIPVLDKNGVACMYDKVSGEFFYNQGEGEFIAGGNKNNSNLTFPIYLTEGESSEIGKDLYEYIGTKSDTKSYYFTDEEKVYITDRYGVQHKLLWANTDIDNEYGMVNVETEDIGLYYDWALLVYLKNDGSIYFMED